MTRGERWAVGSMVALLLVAMVGFVATLSAGREWQLVVQWLLCTLIPISQLVIIRRRHRRGP